jgi:hypothetical protein
VRKLAAIPLFFLAALLLAACGGQKTPNPDDPAFWRVTLRQADVSPVIVNSSLSVGENRLQVGLLDGQQAPILGARVRLLLYRLDGATPLRLAEADARYVALERGVVDEERHEHVHLGETGVYVAALSFDSAGTYGLAISGTLADGRRFGPLPYVFNVLERPPEPMVGEPAPPSRQPTLAQVGDIRELTTDLDPIADFYTLTVAEAVRSGRPTVVAFTTPAFCQSQVCGPVLDSVVKPLYQRYRGQANFVHIEPYRLREAREGIGLCPVPVFNRELARQGQGVGRCPPEPADQLPPTNESWNLSSEPWVFVVDRQGRIAAKFEGVMALDEVEAALRATLSR